MSKPIMQTIASSARRCLLEKEVLDLRSLVEDVVSSFQASGTVLTAEGLDAVCDYQTQIGLPSLMSEFANAIRCALFGLNSILPPIIMSP